MADEDNLKNPIYKKGRNIIPFLAAVVAVIGFCFTVYGVLRAIDEKNIKLMISLVCGWAILPPFWFWCEYFFVYRSKRSEDNSSKAFEYGQKISAALWAGVLAVLLLISSSSYFKSQDNLKEKLVKPYLNVSFNNDKNGKEGMGWFIENIGRGPALIKSISVKGKREKIANLNEGHATEYLQKLIDSFPLTEEEKTHKLLKSDNIDLQHAILHDSRIDILYLDKKYLSEEKIKWFNDNIDLCISIEYQSVLEGKMYEAKHPNP